MFHSFGPGRFYRKNVRIVSERRDVNPAFETDATLQHHRQPQYIPWDPGNTRSQVSWLSPPFPRPFASPPPSSAGDATAIGSTQRNRCSTITIGPINFFMSRVWHELKMQTMRDVMITTTSILYKVCSNLTCEHLMKLYTKYNKTILFSLGPE